MGSMTLLRVSGVLVILGAVSFIAATAIHQAGDLPGYRWLPDDPGEWLLDVNRNRNAVMTETWLKISGMLLSMGAGLGTYLVLRRAGPLLWIGVLVLATNSLLIIAQLLVVLGIASEMAPAYAATSEAIRPALEVTATTLLQIGVLAEFVADHMLQPVTGSLFGLAILPTSVVPHWMGWLSLAIALSRSMGLSEPASDAFRAFSTIGFISGGGVAPTHGSHPVAAAGARCGHCPGVSPCSSSARATRPRR